MHQQYRRVDGGRRPFHQSSMDLLCSEQLKESDTESRRLLHLDEVHQLQELHPDEQVLLQNQDAQRPGDCLTLEDAHQDE
jgi:hypothetical protein